MATYSVRSEFIIKTFENMTDAQILKLITDALWELEEFRDVQLVDWNITQ